MPNGGQPASRAASDCYVAGVETKPPEEVLVLLRLSGEVSIKAKAGSGPRCRVPLLIRLKDLDSHQTHFAKFRRGRLAAVSSRHCNKQRDDKSFSNPSRPHLELSQGSLAAICATDAQKLMT